MTQTLLTPAQIDNGLQFTNGAKWAGPTLTISVPGAMSVWEAMYNGRPDGEPYEPLYSTLSSSQAAAYILNTQIWDSYVALSFTLVADDATSRGDFRVAFTDVNKYSPGAAGYAYSPPLVGQTPPAPAGDMWLPAQNLNLDYGRSTYEFQTLLHEFGHALGLKHPFSTPALATGPNGESYDFWTYSVMSYTPEPGVRVTPTLAQNGNVGADRTNVNLLTPMVLDIQAIQDLYGADTATFAGDTTHVLIEADFNHRQSIYDAGGIDTLDLSQISRGSTVDLRPGAYSDIGYFSKAAQIDAAVTLTGEGYRSYFEGIFNDPNSPPYEWTRNLGIAFSTTIENVIGTAKADTVIGNSVANVFTGGAGADTFTGNGGNDTYRDTAANLNGDSVTDFINADVVTVTDAVAALLGLSYSGSVLSFSFAAAPATTYSMTLNGASGPVQQRTNVSGGVDIYFGVLPPAPVYAIAVSPSSEPEGNGGAGAVLTYTVTRTGDTTSAAMVDVGLTGTATPPGGAGADYAVGGLTAGKLAFAAGATSASFTVTTTPDTTVEPDETVVATISNATGGGTIGTASATGTITDDDTVPPPAQSYAMAVSPTSVAEGDSGAGAGLTFTVTRSDPTNAVTVRVGLGGTATAPGAAGADYAVSGLTGGTLVFAAGAATATFTLTTVPDTDVEPNETVIATVSEVNGDSDLPLATATATIVNDDAAPPATVPSYSIAVAPASVQEGNTGTGNSLVYTVTRTGDTSAATIAVSLTGTATAGTDYTVTGLAGGQLAFAAGAATATFTVVTTPDTTVEPSETVIATIGSAPNGGTIATATATATITNDDVTAPPADTTADAGEPARIVADGTGNGIVDLYESRMASFAVTGLDLDATAVATFTDGSRSTTANVGANGTFAIDLSGLDGTVSSSLAIRDTSGNIASGAGNAIKVDVDAFQSLFGALVKDASGAGGQVFELYQGLLGRAPEPDGFEANVDALAHGATLAQLATVIVTSPEYTARNGSVSAETDAGFVSELYQVVLGRGGEASGLSYWQDILARGASRGEVAAGFALSSENLSQDAGRLAAGVFVPDPVASDVARLYYAILDRAPDAPGMQSWTQAAKLGLSQTAIADQFLRSAEYMSTFGAPSDADFIAQLYDGALGRTPEAQGLAGWQGALQSGQSRASVAVAIADSQEANALHQVQIENGWHVV